MKKLMVFSVFGLAAILAGGVSAVAQDLQSNLIANVPFDFTVGAQQFTAGKYYLTPMGEHMILRNAEGSMTAMFRTQRNDNGKIAGRNQLAFTRHNGEMALEGVRRIGSSDELQIVPAPTHVEAVIVAAGK